MTIIGKKLTKLMDKQMDTEFYRNLVIGSDAIVDLNDVSGLKAVGNLRVYYTLKQGNEISMYGRYADHKYNYLMFKSKGLKAND